MPKPTIRYVCQSCGHETPRWLGRCPECEAWNSFEEEVRAPEKPNAPARRGGALPGVSGRPLPITQVAAQQETRLSSGIGELDRVLGGGIVSGAVTLVGGDPGIGKCLAGSERILDPCTGTYLPITEWATMRRPVVALNEGTGRLVPAAVSAFQVQGVCEIVEVQTRLGRRLRCTPGHPVLTPGGWMPISKLTPGDRIASPRSLPYFGSDRLNEDVVKLIAYVLSDGSAQSAFTVTSALPQVEADLRCMAENLGMTLRIYAKARNQAKQYRLIVPRAARREVRQKFASALTRLRNQRQITWTALARQVGVPHHRIRMWCDRRSVPSQQELERLATILDDSAELDSDSVRLAAKTTPVARILEEFGLRSSRAANKAVPDAIFRLSRPQLALFLKVLFSCDGSVYMANRTTPGLSYSTISHRLATDIQHLLLRFGFVTKLRIKKSLVRGAQYIAYELQMLGVAEVKRFLDEIGIWGREGAKERIASLPVPDLPSTHFDTVPVDAEFWQQVRHAAGGVSFIAISRQAGVVIRHRRLDRPLCRKTILALADSYQTSYLRRLADSDVYWDEIEQIKPAGEEAVYDITVPGAANFVASDLIVHNSTLMTQAAYAVARGESRVESRESKEGGGDKGVASRKSQVASPKAHDSRLTTHDSVLYVSGEESVQQIKLRAERLGAQAEGFLVVNETDVNAILHHIEAERPALVVVDSIQTTYDPSLESAPGTVSQIRDCAAALARLAKNGGPPIFLIGHVTKEGALAGPRVLEHMVDTVLYFEGDRHHAYRILRAVKNRFGSTDEIGLFEMREEGLIEVSNPSEALLAERTPEASGSAVTATLEGTRPLLVEVQGLASRSYLANPRRTATGVELNRLNMLLAVLEKRVGLKLAEQDVYVNVAGGIRILEPAADLAVTLAVASSFREQPVDPNAVLLGEVGLGGEVRAVAQVEKRLREAARMGFTRAILSRRSGPRLKIPGVEIVGVGNVLDAMQAALLPAKD